MGDGTIVLVSALAAWIVCEWRKASRIFVGVPVFVGVLLALSIARNGWSDGAAEYQLTIVIWGGVLAVSLVGAIPLSRAFLRSATRVPAGSRKILAVVLFPVFMVASVVVIGVGLFALVLIGALVVSMAGGEANVAIMDWLDQRRR